MRSRSFRLYSVSARLLTLSFALTIAHAVTAERVLKQVHVVTRHGSRLVLRKGDNLKEFTEGPLTSLGQKQTYDLGLWIKSRYNHKNTSFFFDTYQQDKVYLESSSFERTITSANSLALGLFNATARDPFQESLLPGIAPANVPVYSRDVDSDYFIRAYDKCPAGLQLDELYTSLQFQTLAQQHANLLQTLGEMSRFDAFTDETGGAIALDMLWNVYDSIEVAKTECSAMPHGSTCTIERKELVHLLTPKQWNELQAVAKQVEFLKYGTKNAGRLVGGNLIAEILQRMNEDTSISSDSAPSNELDGFYLYSAHYPVLLGLLAALEEDPVNRESIPAYAAALLFELYMDRQTNEKYVSVLYRPGPNEEGLRVVKTVVLDAVCSADNADETALCALRSLNSYFANFTLKSWCQDCESPANVCLQYITPKSCSLATESAQFTGVAGLFTGLAAGFIGTAVALLVWKQKHRAPGGEHRLNEASHLAVNAMEGNDQAHEASTPVAIA